MEIIKQLEKIGLNQKQANIYIAGLELGEATILQLANKSKIKRSTVYEQINSLLSIGLFKKTLRNKKIFYIANNPNVLKIIQNERSEILSFLMPALNNISSNSKEKTDIYFYNDIEDIRKIYLEKLSMQRTETLGFSSKNFIEKLGNDWLIKYIQKRKYLNIGAKEIVNKNAEKWQLRDDKDLRTTKVLPSDKFFEIGIEIYDECIIISQLTNQNLCLVIESKLVRDAMKTMFEIIWQSI